MKIFRIRFKICFDNGKIFVFKTERLSLKDAKETKDYFKKNFFDIIKAREGGCLQVLDTNVDLSKIAWVNTTINL